MIQFGAPTLLALMLAVVAMACAGLWLLRWRHRARDSFVGPQARLWQPAALIPRLALLLIAATLVVLAAARPQWGTREVTRDREAVDVVIALDISASMQAQDSQPTRLGQAQTHLRSLLEGSRQHRFGLVLFAGTAILRSPLTTDTGAMIELIERANSETGLIRVGSDLGAALEQAGLILDASESAGKAVLVISDGEDHVGAFAQKAAALRDKGILVYTAGAGTPQGATLTEIDPRSRQPRQKLDAQGRPVVTRLVEAALQEVAGAGGGRYVRISSGGEDFLGLREDLDQLQQTPIGAETQNVPIERFQLFAAGAFIALAASWLMPARLRLPAVRWQSLRPRPGLTLALLAMLLGACSGDPLRNQNDRANELFESGDFGGALAAYEELLAERPDVPEISYNAGNTLHRLEDYERAVSETQRALPPETISLGAATYYALGNHLLALDRLDQAYDAYRSALLLDPDDSDAKHNLELTLLRLLAQQQQQQPPQEQPGAGEPGEGEPGEEEGEGTPQDGLPQQPGGQPPGSPPTGNQRGDAIRTLEEALRGLDEELTFEEAIRILDALREQQQRQIQDPAAGGGSSGPDY